MGRLIDADKLMIQIRLSKSYKCYPIRQMMI